MFPVTEVILISRPYDGLARHSMHFTLPESVLTTRSSVSFVINWKSQHAYADINKSVATQGKSNRETALYI
jgi:hypothetical protein